jgi:hypothetical protein
VHDESGQPVGYPTVHRADGRWQADIGPLPPGIHAVTVADFGTSPITQLVLVDQP